MMNLTPEQMQAIHSTAQNTQVIACAGSGKTQVIAERVAWLFAADPEITPDNIVAFTYSRKAAAGLKSRILSNFPQDSQPDLNVTTIHAFCFDILKKFRPEYEEYTILDTPRMFHFLNRYHRQAGYDLTGMKRSSWGFNTFVDGISSTILKRAADPDYKGPFDEAFETYRSFMKEKKYLDYSLMIYEALTILKTDPVAKEWLKQIKYLIVDEYQDIDAAQQELIDQFHQAGTKLFVVGDDDQTIYRFRNSSPEFMIHFSDRYKDTEQIRLTKNFRSRRSIVNAGASVIENNEDRLDKQFKAARNNSNENIFIEEFSSPEEEDSSIAKQASRCLAKGYSTAILVRKRKFIPEIERALAKEQVPYQTASADCFFSSKYYQQLKSTIECFANPDKAVLYGIWKNDISRPAFNTAFRKLRNILLFPSHHGFTASSLIEMWIEETGFLDENAPDLDTRKNYLEGLKIILSDFDEIYSDCQLSFQLNMLSNFLNKFAEDQYRYHVFEDRTPQTSGVSIMTIHQAKGLEFDAVFVPELLEKEFPTTYRQKNDLTVDPFDPVELSDMRESSIDSHLEDERRLFYVALTRAKDLLFLSSSPVKKDTSRFVDELFASSDISSIAPWPSL